MLTLLGLSVRASYTWKTDSKHVTMNLFMGMSRRSKDTPHTPFLTFVSHRNCKEPTEPAAYHVSYNRRSFCLLALAELWRRAEVCRRPLLGPHPASLAESDGCMRLAVMRR